jgi:deoxycitidine kinase
MKKRVKTDYTASYESVSPYNNSIADTPCHSPQSALDTSFNNRVLKIAVEGNIATGKSSFIDLLDHAKQEWAVVPEPVAKWTNVSTSCDQHDLTSSQQHGGNLLKLFYDDINRWAYTFQSYVLFSRLRTQQKPPPPSIMQRRNPVLFYERSWHLDRDIFARNCYENGAMTDTEWNVYQECSDYLVKVISSDSYKLDGLVYLRASPEVCYERMQKRARPEEKCVSLEYLTSLHDKHERLFMERQTYGGKYLENTPMLVIDCNEEFLNSPVKHTEILHKIEHFLRYKVSCDGNDSGISSLNSSSTSSSDSDNLSDIEL